MMGVGIYKVVQLAAAIAFGLLLSACSNNKATSRPMTPREKQDAALKDPFGYKVDANSTDVSGGGIGDFEKDSFKKDLDHVFNP